MKLEPREDVWLDGGLDRLRFAIVWMTVPQGFVSKSLASRMVKLGGAGNFFFDSARI
jgi:hypothetical protein